MATDLQGGRTIVECDSCNATIESERGEAWNAFWPRAKREGWKCRKVAEEWVHGCPRHEV